MPKSARIRVSPIDKALAKTAKAERETAFDDMFAHMIATCSLFSKSTFVEEADAGRRFKVLLSEKHAEFKKRVCE